ncbi:nitric oxide dioxygenase [Cycloclasticus sp. 46_120_T64]|nr:nitric oxide dioxygenase [Cycloclasticus sp. 46_120_T64]
MLDSNTINTIKATLPAVQAHAEQITACFYPLMFEQYPEVKSFFNQTNQANGTQSKALANAVIAYAANIDQLGNLSEAISKIVQKHCSLGIQPEQYPIVGDCLLQAIKQVLGDAATEEVIAAWGKAYQQLADILIAAETEVYRDNEQKAGGWRGERNFTLIKHNDESSVIRSFYFQASDGGALPEFQAGQYITIILDINGQEARRNYSLSDAPGGDYLRISVKREGLVSNYLHRQLSIGDEVKLLPPCGDFTLRKNNKPLVLLTAGVGITPAISMLNEAEASNRKIHFIHAAINSDTHAFKQHVDQLRTDNENISSLYVYSAPSKHCQADANGYVTAELIDAQLGDARDVEFYLLGPLPFMREMLKITQRLGIPNKQVHYEFFGPTANLAA